jgi:hypothetical protein
MVVPLNKHGFEITGKSENELHAIGPGLRSTQQTDLSGVTELIQDGLTWKIDRFGLLCSIYNVVEK